jgi:hypothetical protein
MTAIDDKHSQLPFLGNPVDEGAGRAKMYLEIFNGQGYRPRRDPSSVLAVLAQCPSALADHEARPGAGRHETGLPGRSSALEPGFMAFPARLARRPRQATCDVDSRTARPFR